jgi:hypothetical protein
LVVPASSARAAAPKTLRIVSSDACPRPDAVANALARMLPETRIVGAADDAPVVTLVDLGDGFRVEVGGQARTVPDAKHECEERALTTAIFIAFVLDPPTAPSPPSAPPVVAAPPPPAPRVLRPRLRPEVELELSALFVIAPDETVLTGGGSARVFVGNRWLGGIAGVTALAPATFDVGTAGARLVRVPVDLGLRGRLKLKQVGLSVDAEAVVVPLFVAGTRVAQALSSHGEDVGGRVAASVQLRRWRRWAPFLAIEVVATSRHLLVVESGPTRETPPVWLGLSLGVDARLF